MDQASFFSEATLIEIGVYVVVQFYPWFKFSFLLFLRMVIYDNNMIMSLKQKKRKFEPRIKLSHNIYIRDKVHKKLEECFESKMST